MSEIKKTGPRPPHPTGQNTCPAGSIRQRILEAAFNLFSESGFSPTSMLDIVTRARVSKRDLYALFRNKHAVLAAWQDQQGNYRPIPYRGNNRRQFATLGQSVEDGRFHGQVPGWVSDPCSSSDSAVLAAWVRGICIRLPSCFANSLWSATRS